MPWHSFSSHHGAPWILYWCFCWLQQIYERTLDSLKSAKNESLWFNTNVKLANIYLNNGQIGKLLSKIEELHDACRTESGEDDATKSTWLMEVYALEVQISTDLKRLEHIYAKVQQLKSAVSNSRVLG